MKSVMLLILIGLRLGLVLSQIRQPSSVPFTTDCKLTKSGREYIGPLNVTQSRLTCQRWDSNQPQSHSYTDPSYYPEGNVTVAGNKCRNPDSGYNDGVWCYTTNRNRRWDLCTLAFCECKLSNDMLGVRYQGQMSRTINGRQCRSWASQSPTPHPYRQNSFFPDGSVSQASNYCRNPNASRSDGPWCYTTIANVLWEYCRVPVCNYTLSVSSTKAQTSRQTSLTQIQSSTRKNTSPAATTIQPTTPQITTSLKSISSRTTGLESLTTSMLLTTSSKRIPPPTTSLRTTPAAAISSRPLQTSIVVSSITVSPFTTSLPSTASLRNKPPITVAPRTVSVPATSSKTVQPNSTSDLRSMPSISTRPRPMQSPTTIYSETTAPSNRSLPRTTRPQTTTDLEPKRSIVTGPETVSSSAVNQRTTFGSATEVHSSNNLIAEGTDRTATKRIQAPAVSSKQRETESISVVSIVIPVIIGAIVIVGIIVLIFLWKRTRLFQSCWKGSADSPNPSDKKQSGEDTAAGARNTHHPNNNGFQSTENDGQSTESLTLTKDPPLSDGVVIVTAAGETYIPMNNIKPS